MGVKGEIILEVRSGTLAAFDSAKLAATRQLAEAIERDIRGRVNRPYPPASKPGNYPKRRTGLFRDTVRVLGRTNGIDIVSGVIYGKFLENGTIYMDARPWAARQFIGQKGINIARRFGELVARFVRLGTTSSFTRTVRRFGR